MSKTLNTRIVQKHDTSENWAKAVNFTPLQGEIIVYDDLKKIKLGDGVTKVNDLEFIIEDILPPRSEGPVLVDCSADTEYFNQRVKEIYDQDTTLRENICNVTKSFLEERAIDSDSWSYIIDYPNCGAYSALFVNEIFPIDKLIIDINTPDNQNLNNCTIYAITIDAFRDCSRLQLWGFNSNSTIYYRTLPTELYTIDAENKQIIINNPKELPQYLPSADEVFLKIQWNTVNADNNTGNDFDWSMREDGLGGVDQEGQAYAETVTVYKGENKPTQLVYWDAELGTLNEAPIVVDSEAFSTSAGSHNQALSRNSLAAGFGNTAGGRGFKITAQEEILNEDGTSSGKGKYTLTSVDGIQMLLNGLGVGETLGYSVRLNSASYDRGIIESVDGNNIIVTNFANTYKLVDESYINAPGTENFDETVAPRDYNYLMIVGHPELGDIDIGFNTVIFGEDNIATDASAVATGIGNQALGQYSFATGKNNIAGYCATTGGDGNKAKGPYTQAVGYRNTASGNYAHAEGRETNAIGESSHAEGLRTNANGKYAHAEGIATNANGEASHAEGSTTTAGGKQSHAEGYFTRALGDYSHTSGIGTVAAGRAQTVIGSYNEQDANALFIVGSGSGNSNKKNSFKISENETIINNDTKINGNMTITNTITIGSTSVTESELANAKLQADWNETDANSGAYIKNKPEMVQADWSVTNESNNAYIKNKPPVRSGRGTGSVELTPNVVATGNYSQAEGVTSSINTIVYETFNDALEAWNTKNFLRAFGYGSHAEGINTMAYGQASHTEGEGSKAAGWTSHAEGNNTQAKGAYSHAEGQNTVAASPATHAGGLGTVADSANMTAIGKYNTKNSKALFAVGNGEADNVRSNAMAVYEDYATVVSSNDYSCMRNIKVGTTAPSNTDGNDGDIYLWVED